MSSPARSHGAVVLSSLSSYFLAIMSERRKDPEERGSSESSLWTTPAGPTVHVEATPDPTVTADDLRRAIKASRERAAAFDLRERRRQGLRELSKLTQEFGGYDREFENASGAGTNGGTNESKS